MTHDQAIEAAVEAKLLELDQTAYGDATGRRYEMVGTNEDGSPITSGQHRENRRRVLRDVAERLGLHFFEKTDAVLLDQLVTVSAIHNHDTAGLLRSLINSFLIAYTNAETTRQAYEHLQGLELLRARLERGVGATTH